jgi:hypothetical protein
MKKMKIDSFNLIEAKLIKNDILSTLVSYFGGCEKHEFALGAIPAMTDSNSTLQANLVLGHENNGDTCKKMVKEHLNFDLSPLKEKYRQTYKVKVGSVMLHLMNREINIKYDFK